LADEDLERRAESVDAIDAHHAVDAENIHAGLGHQRLSPACQPFRIVLDLEARPGITAALFAFFGLSDICDAQSQIEEKA
jgi:hypothetical protein